MYLGILVKIEVSFLSLLTLFKSEEYRKSHMIPPPKRFSGVHTQPPPPPPPPNHCYDDMQQIPFLM